MCNVTYTASIVRSEDGERLAIIFRDSAGTGNTRTGWGFPADEAGIEAAKAAIKNDGMARKEDFDGIDLLAMPEPGEESDEAALTGAGDAA